MDRSEKTGDTLLVAVMKIYRNNCIAKCIT